MRVFLNSRARGREREREREEFPSSSFPLLWHPLLFRPRGCFSLLKAVRWNWLRAPCWCWLDAGSRRGCAGGRGRGSRGFFSRLIRSKTGKACSPPGGDERSRRASAAATDVPCARGPSSRGGGVGGRPRRTSRGRLPEQGWPERLGQVLQAVGGVLVQTSRGCGRDWCVAAVDSHCARGSGCRASRATRTCSRRPHVVRP